MKKLNISQVDTMFANGSYPIEMLIYYRQRLNTKSIRAALRKLSADFWPVFGEYQAGSIQFETYAEAEHLDEEVLAQTFDVNEPAAGMYARFRDSVTFAPNKLFFLKILHYRNGTVLIPKLLHLVGDGYSYFYFLSLLAAVSRGSYLPLKTRLMRRLYRPHHHRTILKAFHFQETAAKPLPAPGEIQIEFETMPRAALRDQVAQAAADLNLPLTANDVVCAKLAQKMAALPGKAWKAEFQLTIPIDVRRQIKAYGPRYFGNGLLLKTITLQTREVIETGLAELAGKIRAAMPTVNAGTYRQYLEDLEALIAARQLNQLKPFDPHTGILVTNISKLPLKRLDFGSGSADMIYPLTIEKHSTAILGDKDHYVLRLVY